MTPFWVSGAPGALRDLLSEIVTNALHSIFEGRFGTAGLELGGQAKGGSGDGRVARSSTGEFK